MEYVEKASIITSLIKELRENDSWCGETHIQKAMYFLENLLKEPLQYGFILYKYGPYSFSLAEDITALMADQVLKLKPQPYPYGSSVLVQETPFTKSIPLLPEKLREKLSFIGRELGPHKVSELERLSTALYVTLNKMGKTVNSRAKKINELKPHISLEQAEISVKDIDKIIDKAKLLM